MPLHNWNTLTRWDGFHTLWIGELLRWVKPRLPEGYRAYLGTTPRVAVGDPDGSPDVSVRRGPGVPPPEQTGGAAPSDSFWQPDEEVAVGLLEQNPALFVSQEGWLVAAVELVSPRNKDRPSARDFYTSRYAGYLLGGVHLALIDLHPRPYGFSFADAIARALEFSQPPVPSPLAVAYRVGEPMGDRGSLLGLWRRPLTVGQPLPPLPLPLTVHAEVVLDLEQTYMQSAGDTYLV
jgi:uncharacterized protein DUF4058